MYLIIIGEKKWAFFAYFYIGIHDSVIQDSELHICIEQHLSDHVL